MLPTHENPALSPADVDDVAGSPALDPVDLGEVAPEPDADPDPESDPEPVAEQPAPEPEGPSLTLPEWARQAETQGEARVYPMPQYLQPHPMYGFGPIPDGADVQ